MQRKSFVLGAIRFGVESLIEHVRLFVIVLLTGTGLITAVVGLIAVLNKNFIHALMASQAYQNLQECVGSDCFYVAYSVRSSIMDLVVENFVSILISAFVLFLFFVGFDLGFKKVALDLHDRDQSSLKAMFSCFKLAPKALIAWMLYALIVWIGWLFFILPGFIASIRFAFFPYFIIDKEVGPIEALKRSYEVTKHHMWDLFAFWVAMKFIIYLGFVSWVSVILTWPLSTLAYAFFYRKLVLDSSVANRDEFKPAF